MEFEGSVLAATPSFLPRVGEQERPSIIHKRDPQTTHRQDQKTLCGESTGQFARTHTRKLSGRTEECRECIRERERRAASARADGGQQVGVGTPRVAANGDAGVGDGVVAVVDGSLIPFTDAEAVEIGRAEVAAAGVTLVVGGLIIGSWWA